MQEFKLTTSRHELHAVKWEVASPKKAVCVVHGFGEHIYRYTHVASHFNSKEISCYGIDLPGHGKSTGKRGDIRSLQDYMLAIDALIECTIQNNPNTPIVLYGHSMGGALSLRYLLLSKTPPTAALITSPWLTLTQQPNSLQVILGRTALVLGLNMAQPTDLKPEYLSRDMEVGKQYKNDPLILQKITPRTFFGLRDNGNYLLKSDLNFSVPILLAHGDDDPITQFEASAKFAQNHNQTVTFKRWENLRHETHNETTKKEVLDFYAQWILSQS